MFTGAVTDNYWRSTSHMKEDPWAQAVPAQTSGRRRPKRKPAVSEWREWTWREGSMWMVISKQRKGGGERWCYRERWWHGASVHYNFIPLVKRMVHQSLVSACIVNSSLYTLARQNGECLCQPRAKGSSSMFLHDAHVPRVLYLFYPSGVVKLHPLVEFSRGYPPS